MKNLPFYNCSPFHIRKNAMLFQLLKSLAWWMILYIFLLTKVRTDLLNLTAQLGTPLWSEY